MVQNERDSMTKAIKVEFRWPMKVVSETAVEVLVPVGNGLPLINPDAVDQLLLSKKEVQAAEDAALRAIVVID